MAEIVRDKTGRVLFTKQMREEGYAILAPNMLPVHFKLFAKAFQQAGYKPNMKNARSANRLRAFIFSGD